jgi:hypothetical protein
MIELKEDIRNFKLVIRYLKNTMDKLEVIDRGIYEDYLEDALSELSEELKIQKDLLEEQLKENNLINE